MIKTKKGTVFTVIFYLLVFGILFTLGLSSWLNDVGTRAVEEHGYTGVEAFFYENITVFIIFILIIAIFALSRFG
ncbi:hypothetical protein KY333_04845 [Candidatus Woesearchaeota archaeon]|nr:hypothetical protein [Candidatus Woesearchaeota archaeon]